jgi:hypothetical protein
MWKIAVVLILTALAILGAGLAYGASCMHLRAGELNGAVSPAPLAPPLMYAGVRG